MRINLLTISIDIKSMEDKRIITDENNHEWTLIGVPMVLDEKGFPVGSYVMTELYGEKIGGSVDNGRITINASEEAKLYLEHHKSFLCPTIKL
jgi:hypothetical protein